MIVIIDYGLSNLRSVGFKLRKYNKEVIISSDKEEISKANKLILAGVGHFGKAMNNLKDLDLIPLLDFKVIKEQTPIFGICLGMQLFTESSEEGNSEGFGWIKGKTKKFNFDSSFKNLRIPHVGWNTIQIKKQHPLFSGMDNRDFYFTHSFFVGCQNSKDILAESTYGHNFVSAISKGNILGTQFHPEKSHPEGFKLLKNFINV